jgi:hypothetical protein
MYFPADFTAVVWKKGSRYMEKKLHVSYEDWAR